MSKAFLGILINDSLWKGIQKRNMGHEKLEFYQAAGRKYHLTPCYFRLQDISVARRTTTAFINQNGRWIKRQLPLPQVIHNRAILHTKQAYQKIKQLSKKHRIFNLWNRYSKFYISHLLGQNEAFLSYLPTTVLFTPQAIEEFKVCYPSFLLKPDKGTVGMGIIKLDKINDSLWKLRYRKGKQVEVRLIHGNQLVSKLKPLVGAEKYLIQQTIPLATYQGSPFDIRVSVQKGMTGDWQITGMVAKVAKRGHFLSNVAQGGRVVALEQIIRSYSNLSIEQVISDLSRIALAITSYLDIRLPHVADIGYDFGIDRQGHPYFIEMNSRDQRYSFAKANRVDLWKKTYENPVGYARYLLDRKEGEKGGT
ncbi:MAG TPA: YheC/YheD family protein [Bacillota bacterium]|nr:YheC/YheD family protein [Bacillota bacterium]